MEAAAVWLAKKLAEFLMDPVSQQLQYLFCADKIAKNVQIVKEELKIKQRRVQECVQEATNRTERIDDEVDKWKKDVKSLIEEVEKLQEELRDNNGYLEGCCPTWKRYCLCEKLAETTKRMIDLKTKGEHFNPFSHRINASDIEHRSFQNFKFFNSTQMAYDQLWEALQDDDSSIIGLRGMGGSGKTTLVRVMEKKAKESQLFNRFVFITISQKIDINKIQRVIAEALGLKLEEEDEVIRANRIALRFQSGERILIILDDVWAMLNLEEIGIPIGGNHKKRCKVVLTTRLQNVCTLMGCQKVIQLDLLNKDDAWTLFQTHANIDVAARESKAREIAMECKGLPIAIVAVGTCLKGKGIDEMNVMLYRLKNAKPINVDKSVRDAFTCLKLSYDYLATQEAKLLLMCAMFPEDHDIVVEDLFRYGVGLGLCRDVDSFETIRSEVRTTINHLIDSSLLMRSLRWKMNGQEYVRMHDVVRDFALWKAFEEDHPIMVDCTTELCEFIAKQGVENCYAISSWYGNNELVQFPSQLVAPKLEFLLLHITKPLDISHSTFGGIKRLGALIIMYNYLASGTIVQPQSLQHLSNLRTLRLQRLDLCDISFVVTLTRLEILDLQGSRFKRVPNGIEKLNKLKLLDLSRCIIYECCYKVLRRCSQLEELYVPRHFLHSENENCYEYLVGSAALMKLKRYNLEIGENDDEDSGSQDEVIRSLHLGQLNISMLDATIKDLAQRATVIGFNELQGGIKSFMPDIIQAAGGMDELTKLCFKRCPEIECIIDKTSPHEDMVVPILDELLLEDMDNLKQICRGPSPFSLFQKLGILTIFNCLQLLHIFPARCNLGNLKFLDIAKCPMLTSLFPVSTACTLFSLKKLTIQKCYELKHVVEGEGDGDACEEQLMHDQDEMQIVIPLLQSIKLKNLPKLVRICSEGYRPMWPSMEAIAWEDCPIMDHHSRDKEYKPQVDAEGTERDNCRVESISHYQIGVEEQFPKFLYLTQLTLRHCDRLKFVFSAPLRQSLPELTSILISCCEELEVIFGHSSEDDGNYGETIVLSSLRRIWLINLPNFVGVCQGSQIQVELRDISIQNCPKFVDSSLGKALQQLGTISVSVKDSNVETSSNINEEKGMVLISRAENLCLEDSMSLISVWEGPTFIAFQNLKLLDVSRCRKLKCMFPSTVIRSLPCLWCLRIEECEELEEMMSEEEVEMALPNESSHSSFCFPQLQYLSVKRCGKLKWLFPSLLSTQHFPQLNELFVEECYELKGLFNSEVEIHEEEAFYYYNNLLPKLTYLTVRECPIFSETTLAALQRLTDWDDWRKRKQTCPDFVAEKRRKHA